MKKVKNIIGLVFLAITISVYPSQPTHEAKSTQEAIEQIDKKMSLFGQIVTQASIIVDSSDQTIRARAKKELTRLMKHSALSVQIKDLIKDDIEVIKTAKTLELTNAYQRLLDTYEKINAKAFSIETIIEATEMVENASPENLEETIAQAQQKIKDAEQEEQGFMGRAYAKAKRFVTAPVDYVFGKEASYLKTAFYAAVGLAVVTAATYSGYQYGVNDPANVLVPGLSFMIRKDNPENLKTAFIGRFQTLTNLQNKVDNMDPERKREYLKYNSHWLTDTDNDVKALEKALSVFIPKDNIEEIKNKIRAGEYLPNQQIVRDSPFGTPPKRRFFGLNPFYE